MNDPKKSVTHSFHHDCRKGGPSTLPVTWDRVAGGGRVSCPICGLNKLAATIHGASV